MHLCLCIHVQVEEELILHTCPNYLEQHSLILSFIAATQRFPLCSYSRVYPFAFHLTLVEVILYITPMSNVSLVTSSEVLTSLFSYNSLDLSTCQTGANSDICTCPNYLEQYSLILSSIAATQRLSLIFLFLIRSMLATPHIKLFAFLSFINR